MELCRPVRLLYFVSPSVRAQRTLRATPVNPAPGERNAQIKVTWHYLSTELAEMTRSVRCAQTEAETKYTFLPFLNFENWFR